MLREWRKERRGKETNGYEKEKKRTLLTLMSNKISRNIDGKVGHNIFPRRRLGKEK